MSYGDDIAAPTGFEPGAEDDEFGSADYESAAEFDSEDEAEWDEDDEVKH
jgi:hypothetical protein